MAALRFTSLIVLALLGSPALGADYLNEVTSQVYQMAGTPREIASRATTCIAQNLRSGTTDAPLILSSDLDNGLIVAQNALRFDAKANEWQIRSRFTFEAREGRFRITQTDLEMFSPIMSRWGRFVKGGIANNAEATFAASADAVAQCVISGLRRKDW